MHTLKANSTFGNFRFDAEVEVDDATLLTLANAGFLQVLQRSPATAAEKALGGFEKRPKDFKRTEIPYSEANAKVLAEHLEKVTVEADSTVDADGKEVPGPRTTLTPVVNVGEHVPNSGGEPKYKAAKDAIKLYLVSGATPGKLANGEPRTVTSYAENRGIAAPSGDAWEDDTVFLAAVTAWQKAQDAKPD